MPQGGNKNHKLICDLAGELARRKDSVALFPNRGGLRCSPPLCSAGVRCGPALQNLQSGGKVQKEGVDTRIRYPHPRPQPDHGGRALTAETPPATH
ncbi:hypothetical protein AAFF_G00224300 [Aldrovandia affinis]|uniref:Uncharacterized protein n=1 Tax=Aldrovandia affinis TaxID=143900 RepID=A0AAD7TAV3_9TELE|nr:hypothetical protein AAFF_G00224300 [Aldrovandia affinis]